MSGALRVWDMTMLASTGNVELYVYVVLASTAIPLVFPPVRIGCEEHFDGGVRASFVIPNIVAEFVKEADKSPEAPISVELDVVFNTFVSHAATEKRPDDSDIPMLHLASRGLDLFATEAVRGTMYRAAYKLSRVPNLNPSIRLRAILLGAVKSSYIWEFSIE